MTTLLCSETMKHSKKGATIRQAKTPVFITGFWRFYLGFS
jgi:hypothetical protein